MPEPINDSLARRAALAISFARDPVHQAREYELCARDPVYWLSRWGWLQEPRNAALGLPTHLPFDPFPKQVALLRWLLARERRQESGVVEKSREVGVTWLCAAYVLHGWLFVDHYAAGFGSRILELVDRLGDPDCIFEKIRHLLYNLPPWMMPARFDRRQHDNQARLVNPHNGSTIVGKGGDEMGRGGRYSIFVVDEAAHLEHPDTVDSALSMSTNVRIDVSTPSGQGNPFYRKRFSGALPVFSFHWRDDPRKDDAWYEAKKRVLIDPVLIAEQLDMDYAASVPNVAIPARWVRAAVGLSLPPSGPMLAGLDVGWERGNTVLITRCGPVVYDPVSWTGMDTTNSARRARDETERAGARLLYYDAPGVGETATAFFRGGDRPLRFLPVPVHTGQAATARLWPDGQTSREKFRNLRAEMWWMLRVRFERAWEYAERGVPHRPEDLISLPDCPELIAQLSLPTYHRLESGKVGIEQKDQMRKRGVTSPDLADALMLAYTPLAPPVPAAAGGDRFASAPGPAPVGTPSGSGAYATGGHGGFGYYGPQP